MGAVPSTSLTTSEVSPGGTLGVSAVDCTDSFMAAPSGPVESPSIRWPIQTASGESVGGITGNPTNGSSEEPPREISPTFSAKSSAKAVAEDATKGLCTESTEEPPVRATPGILASSINWIASKFYTQTTEDLPKDVPAAPVGMVETEALSVCAAQSSTSTVHVKEAVVCPWKEVAVAPASKASGNVSSAKGRYPICRML